MISKASHFYARVTIQVVTILSLLIAATASVPSAGAVAPPKNDDFYQAVKFTGSVNQTISDINLANLEDPDGSDPILNCDGGGDGEVSVWYTFTPNSTGDLVVSTAGSGYDTIVTVFRAIYYYDPTADPTSWSDPWDLEELGCNDDAGGTTTTSKLNIALHGGTRYYIEVVRKSGAVISAPDPLKFSAKWTTKVTARVGLYDAFQTPPFYYTPVGWTLKPVLPGITYRNNVAVGNNPGDSAIVFYDGDPVELCYVKGPDMGTLNVTIDGQLIGSINQGNSVYVYDCLQFWYAGPFMPDTVHKIVFQHAGPPGTKVNIDTLEVVGTPPDFWDPDPIWDLDLPYKYTLSLNPPDPPASKVVMQWTAPGDDGLYGRVKKYEVRYINDADWVTNGSNDPWDDATWDAATSIVTGVPDPLMGGKIQTMTITGLAPGTYHFNVIGVDDVDNPVMPCGFCYSNDYEYIITEWASGIIGPGMYDDRFSGLKYSGVWKNIASPDNYKNTIRVGTKVDSAVQLTFTGSQFRYYYNTGYNLGTVDVYLDGAYLTTINQSTLYPHRWKYVSPMMSFGPHTVRFVMTSTKYMVMDAILIAGITDGGPPDPIDNLTVIPGLTDGSVVLNWNAKGDDPAIPGPAGTATSYEVRYSLNPITTELEWLAADPAPGLVPVPQASGSAESMTVTGLIPGFTYWFAVRATDDADYSVLSNTTSGQAATVPAFWAGPGYYEDSDFVAGTWRYYGSWTWDTSLPLASNSDEHIAGSSGKAAAFLFKSTNLVSNVGFRLIFQKGATFGVLKVYVDGVLVGVIDQHQGATLWQETWDSPTFLPGNHTVEFVSSGKVNIDAIEIVTLP